MQTHEDRLHEPDFEKKNLEFLKHLQRRAEDAAARGDGQIAYGGPDEKPLAEWNNGPTHVRHMPDDEQGILRISVGGGHPDFDVNYCTIRGDREECIALLNKALNALLRGPRG